MKREKLILYIFAISTIMIFLPLAINAEEEIPVIEDIKIDLIKDSPQIKILSNTPIEYLDYSLEQPSRIIIDPLGVVYSNLKEQLFSGENLIRAVSVVKSREIAPKKLGDSYYALDFVIIELKKPVHYSISREEGLVVKLGKEILMAPKEKAKEIVSRPKIEIAEVEEAKEEKKILPVGKEFFDEEKFPLVDRYKIESGDELEISVWQQPELLRKVVVRPDGFISFPLAGDIEVNGLTTDRIARELALRLSRVFRKPEVSVIVTSFGSKSIFVLGAVNKPGLYPHNMKITVLRAISMADSWQPHAYLKTVLVVRKFFTNKAEVIQVNMWDVIKKGDVKKDIELQPGDIVYVPQSVIGNIGTFLDGLRVRFGTGASYTID